MSEAFIERFASVLYESDNFVDSWSDAHQVDRSEYLDIARREVGALLAEHAHELAEKIRTAFPHDYGALVIAEHVRGETAWPL